MPAVRTMGGLAGAIACVVLTGSCAGGDADAPQEVSRPQGGSSALTRSFAALRTAPEGLPTALRMDLQGPLAGMRYSLAQRMGRWLGAQVWLVPGRASACLVIRLPPPELPSASCAPKRHAISHGVQATSIYGDTSTPQRLTIGVAPDRTRAVRLITPGYRTTQARVRGGAFLQRDEIPNPPDSAVLIPRP
jgi:hypothetical protein